jgi:hypothetical protein
LIERSDNQDDRDEDESYQDAATHHRPQRIQDGNVPTFIPTLSPYISPRAFIRENPHAKTAPAATQDRHNVTEVLEQVPR